MRKYLFILAMAFATSAYSQTLESKVSAMLNEAIAESHANGYVAIMGVSTGKLLVSIGDIDKVQPTKIQDRHRKRCLCKWHRYYQRP